MLYFIIILFWLLMGLLGYLLIYAYFTRKYPSFHYDRRDFLYFIIFGIPNLVAVILILIGDNGFFHIFKYGIKI